MESSTKFMDDLDFDDLSEIVKHMPDVSISEILESACLYKLALIYAARGSHHKFILKMAQAGVGMKDTDVLGQLEIRSKISKAVKELDFDALRKLFETEGVSEFAMVGKSGYDLISSVILCKCSPIFLSFMFEQYAAVNENTRECEKHLLNGANSHGITPLISAVLADNLGCVEHLLEKGADIHITDTRISPITDNSEKPEDSERKTGGKKETQKKTFPKNVMYGTSKTPLMYAACTGNIECVKILLKYKPDITKKCLMGLTALTYAAVTSNYACLELLLTTPEQLERSELMANVSKTSDHGLAKQSEILSGDSFCFTATEEKDDKANTGLKGKNRDIVGVKRKKDDVVKQTQVEDAKEKESTPVSQDEEESENDDDKESDNDNNNTANDANITEPAKVPFSFDFNLTSTNSSEEKVTKDNPFSFNFGLDTSAKLQPKFTIGDFSSSKGTKFHHPKSKSKPKAHTKKDGKGHNPDFLKNLLDTNNDSFNQTNIRQIAEASLPFVIFGDDMKCLKLLLNYCGYLGCKDKYGKTSLMLAAERGKTDFVEVLLNNWAGVDFPVSLGMQETALMLAAQNGHTECVALLLRHHANVDALNWNKETPLMYALKSGKLDCVKILLEHKANINKMNGKEQSPLMIALEVGATEDVVKLLLEHGALIQVSDWCRKNVIMYAAESGNVEILDMLLQAVKKQNPPIKTDSSPSDGNSPPKDDVSPHTSTDNPSSDAVSSPSNGDSSPKDAVSPPSTADSPPTDAVSPSSNGDSPPTDAVSTSSNGDSPPTDAVSPSSNGDSPPTDAVSPSSNGDSPPTDAVSPSSNGDSPPTDAVSPSSNGDSPPTDAVSPSSNGDSPPTDAVSPSSNGDSPPTDAVSPSSNGDSPPTDAVSPSSNGDSPPTDAVSPSSNGDSPPSNADISDSPANSAANLSCGSEEAIKSEDVDVEKAQETGKKKMRVQEDNSKPSLKEDPEQTIMLLAEKALPYAVRGRSLKCLEMLLPYCKNFNQIEYTNNTTALMIAVKKGYVDVLKLLIKHGVDVKFVCDGTGKQAGDLGVSAVICATLGKKKECLQILLENGASPNDGFHHTLDVTRQNAVTVATIHNDVDCLKLLVEYGGDITSEDSKDMSALSYAISSKESQDCLKVLLSSGIQIDITKYYDERKLKHLLKSPENLEMMLKEGHLIMSKEIDNAHDRDGYALPNLRADLIPGLQLLMEYQVFDWKFWCNSAWFKELLVIALRAGVTPKKFYFQEAITSPFQHAIRAKNEDVLRYLVSNLYFTLEDYKWFLSFYSSEESKSESKEAKEDDDSDSASESESEPDDDASWLSLDLRTTLCSKAWRLETLCLLTISDSLINNSISSRLPRTKQVDALPIPRKFKTILKYDGPYSRLCFSGWSNIGFDDFGPIPSGILCLTKMTYPLEEKLELCDDRDCLFKGIGFNYKDKAKTDRSVYDSDSHNTSDSD